MRILLPRVFAIFILALILIGCRNVDSKIASGFAKSAKALDSGATKVAHAANKREDQFNAGWKKAEPTRNSRSGPSSDSAHDDSVDLSFLLAFMSSPSHPDSAAIPSSQPALPLHPQYELRTHATGPRLDLVALARQVASLPPGGSEERLWRHLGLGWPPPVQIDRAGPGPQPVQYVRLMVGTDADLIYGRDRARGQVTVPPWCEGLDWPKPAAPPPSVEAISPPPIQAPAGAAAIPDSGKDAP